MRQIRFWAIAPIAVLATFSGKLNLSSPVINSVDFNQPHKPGDFQANLISTTGNAVLAQASPKPPPSPQQSPTQKPTIQPSPTPDVGLSKVILEQKGELNSAKSSVLPSDKSLYDQYTFEGNQGQTVVISVESSDFDTYLAVFSPNGDLLQENDDVTKQNSNSEITVTLSASGRYRVIVNAYEAPPKGQGKYSLTVRETMKK
jgi:Bacterial pre-peptidase C-terminal domain